MPDPDRHHAVAALMREMGLTESGIERRKRIVGIEPADLNRIASIREVVIRETQGLTDSFFQHLSGLEEARPLFGSHALLERARHLKKEHLVAMVQGDYRVPYVEQRVDLALLYSRAGLETRGFLGAFHHLLTRLGSAVVKQSPLGPIEGFDAFASLQKVAFFDIAVIVDVLVQQRERVIDQQQDAIRELSTPVLPIRDRLLLLPIIGLIDTRRSRLITEGLLHGIRANRAKVVVMDITGVAVIDSKVANHLMQTVSAAKLMGTRVIITGVSAEVAQALVALGLDLSALKTVGDLQGGLEEAERMLGSRLARNTEPPSAAYQAEV